MMLVSGWRRQFCLLLQISPPGDNCHVTRRGSLLGFFVTVERSSRGCRVWRVAFVALLLMGLSLMCILMVNVPGWKAMAAALPELEAHGFAHR